MLLVVTPDEEFLVLAHSCIQVEIENRHSIPIHPKEHTMNQRNQDLDGTIVRCFCHSTYVATPGPGYTLGRRALKLEILNAKMRPVLGFPTARSDTQLDWPLHGRRQARSDMQAANYILEKPKGSNGEGSERSRSTGSISPGYRATLAVCSMTYCGNTHVKSLYTTGGLTTDRRSLDFSGQGQTSWIEIQTLRPSLTGSSAPYS
ncbi:hypothetical protein K474DRAFT_1049115 [Panus rudis PR-1116 ss-1]|nr:hypothetical protein K474DRAFT_1049115 [Panus rudis PR-1116 ss-1]